jgi:hypothetical protein
MQNMQSDTFCLALHAMRCKIAHMNRSPSLRKPTSKAEPPKVPNIVRIDPSVGQTLAEFAKSTDLSMASITKAGLRYAISKLKSGEAVIVNGEFMLRNTIQPA